MVVVAAPYVVACALMLLLPTTRLEHTEAASFGLVIGLIVVGLVSGLVNVGLLTLRQRRTDPEQLGRVLAVSISLNLLGMPIGSAVGGFVIERSSALAFVVAGVAAALGAAAMWVMVPNHAR